jgi:hypothetical protein
MIIWILFGHLMTPEQYQTTTEIQCSRSGKFEVIASIRSQPKQRSENQRVWGRRSLGPEIVHAASPESTAPDGVAPRWRKRHH